MCIIRARNWYIEGFNAERAVFPLLFFVYYQIAVKIKLLYLTYNTRYRCAPLAAAATLPVGASRDPIVRHVVRWRRARRVAVGPKYWRAYVLRAHGSHEI